MAVRPIVLAPSTVGGVTVVAILADRYLRSTLLGALSLFAAVLLTLGCAAHLAVALYAAVACWGTAFGAAPTLIQVALIDAAGPEHGDVATAMQTAAYNTGIAAGSFAGGLALRPRRRRDSPMGSAPPRDRRVRHRRRCPAHPPFLPSVRPATQRTDDHYPKITRWNTHRVTRISLLCAPRLSDSEHPAAGGNSASCNPFAVTEVTGRRCRVRTSDAWRGQRRTTGHATATVTASSRASSGGSGQAHPISSFHRPVA